MSEQPALQTSAQKFLLALVFALAPQAASADTVSVAAKPYMVGGGFAAAAVFIGLGLFLILRGRGTRRMAAQSVAWPIASGQILEASVRTEKRNDGSGGGTTMEVYVPQVRYCYSVAHTRYEGDLIRPGIAQFGYGVKAAAQTHIDLYKIGATVPVHYDPADAAVAVLETTEYGGSRNIFGGALFALVGIGCAFFAVWASGLEAR